MSGSRSIRACTLVAGLSACFAHTPPAAECPVAAEPYQRTELYFGLSHPGGKRIEPTTFEAFVEEYVVPQLPTGFTILAGEGRWAAGTQDIREDSRLLIVLHHGDLVVEQAIESIRTRYRKLFSQQSVLRVDSRACARF